VPSVASGGSGWGSPPWVLLTVRDSRFAVELDWSVLGCPSQGRRPGCASVSNWPRALRRFRPLAASFWLFMAWWRLQSHWRFVRSSLPPSSWGVRWSSSRGPAHGPRLACWHEWSSSRVAVSRVRFHSLVDVREFPLVNAMACPLSPALAPEVPLPPCPGWGGSGCVGCRWGGGCVVPLVCGGQCPCPSGWCGRGGRVGPPGEGVECGVGFEVAATAGGGGVGGQAMRPVEDVNANAVKRSNVFRCGLPLWRWW
jgi:hypothetical protein